AVHGRSVGGVNVDVESKDFQVINNELGDVRLDTGIRVTGEIRRPRIEGDVGVSTGTLDIAQLLARFAANPYEEDEQAPGDQGPEDAVERVRSNARIQGRAEASEPDAGADTAPNLSSQTKAEQDRAAAETGQETAEAEAAAAASPSVFEALDLDVTFSIPDDL